MGKEKIKKKLLQAVKNNAHVAQIKSVAIFGSYVNGQATQTSDLDVLIEFTDDAHIGLFEYARIQRNLGETVGVKIDLVTPEALSKYIKTQVLQEAEVVYQK